MARAYTVSASKYWDDAAFGGGTARQGADTYSITSGAVLTIDTDTRTCSNSSEATGCAGNIAVSNGQLLIDGSKVRLIPYNSGSGNVPAFGTTISQGGVSGTTLGVWATLASAPTLPGSAMPASGYIKVRSVTGGAFAAGAITGIGATATGADVVGWLEVVGVESSSISFGSDKSVGAGAAFNATGAWFAAGTTPATPATSDTYQLPASYANTYYSGVQVETGNGTGVYEWWPSAGAIAANTLATDARAKVCWISSQGLLRFGSDGTNTGGMLPPASSRIRVPNIVTINTNSAATTAYTVAANAAPSATLGTRFRIVSSDNINSDLSLLTGAWCFTVSNGHTGFKWHVDRCCFADELGFGAIYDPQITDCCVGPSGINYTAIGVPVTMGYFYPGAVDGLTAAQSKVNSAAISMGSPSGWTLENIKAQLLVARTANNISAILVDNGRNLTIDNITVIGGRLYIYNGAQSITVGAITYSDTINGTTGTGFPLSVFSFSGKGLVFTGPVSWVTTTANACHPYTGVISLDRGTDAKVSGIGSYASPLNLGSVNVTGGIIRFDGSQSLERLKVNRCYATTPRNAPIDYGSTRALGSYNLFSDIYTVGMSKLLQGSSNSSMRGGFGIVSGTNFLPGYHFQLSYQSTIAGTIYFSVALPLSVEPSASSCTTSGTVAFPTGAIYMPAVDDQIVWKIPYKVRGYTAFSGAAALIAGPTAANFLIEYSLDLGVTWKAASSGNLTGETLPASSVGFDFWVRITCTTANTSTTTNGITGLSFPMTTTASDCINTYALEEITFTESGTLAGSSVAWVNPGGASVFGFYTGTGTEVTYQNEDGTEKTGTYRVRKAGYDQYEGTWQETSSWYRETKTYFVSQALKEATIADSGGITFVGDTSATLGASKTFQQLYSNAQHWSCLEANMLYSIPVVSAGGGAYSANVDVVTTGYTLNGSGSLSMGSKALSSEFASGTDYTYTGGTFSQASTTPSFSGGTLTLPTKITSSADFSITGATIEFGAAGADWNLSDATFSGTITLATTAGQSVTVAMPTGVTINNTEPGNITVTTPILSADIEWAGALDGTTVLLYNDSDAGALIDTQTVSGAGGYLWSITLPHADVAVGDTLRLRFGHKAYYADELQGTMTASGLTFVGSMTLHPVYAAWALDGADYDQANGGPYTMDGTNLQVDIAAGSTTGTKVQLGAWTQYLMTLPAGLAAFYGAWDLLAVNQIRQNVGVIDVKIDVPTAGALFTFTDNNVNYYRSDFTFPGNVQSGHGLIAITYDASPFVATVAGGDVVTGTPASVAAAVRSELGTELTATLEVWRRHGLDIAAPLTQTTAAITAGDIDLAITGDPNVSITVTRQP